MLNVGATQFLNGDEESAGQVAVLICMQVIQRPDLRELIKAGGNWWPIDLNLLNAKVYAGNTLNVRHVFDEATAFC